jgi:hypothetical protein
MTKRHTVTLHHDLTDYNDILRHIAGVIQALARKKTQWNEVLFFAVK